jgi:hypothetical protein
VKFIYIFFYHLLEPLILDGFIGHNRDIVSVLEDRHIGTRQVAHYKKEGAVKKEAGLMNGINTVGWERTYVGIYNVHETYRVGAARA